MPKNFSTLLNTTGVMLVVVFSTIFELLLGNQQDNNSTLLGFSAVILIFVVYMLFKSWPMVNTQKKQMWLLVAIIAAAVISFVVFRFTNNTDFNSYKLFISVIVMVGLNILILKDLERE